MNSSTFFYNFGRNVFGPILKGYTHWLIAHSASYEKIIFQVRGGYILWLLYEMLKPSSAPPGVLMYASRRCVGSPAFAAYVKSLVGDAKKVATADTGWWGNMQDRIWDVTKVKIQGMYLGSRCHTNQGKSGYLFEQWWDHEKKDFQIWETVLNMLCGCPGVVSVNESEGVFSFVFDDYEFNLSDVEHFRAGVIAAAKDNSKPPMSGVEAFAALRRIHYEPTADEAKYLGDVKHGDKVWRFMDGNIIKHWKCGQRKRRERR